MLKRNFQVLGTSWPGETCRYRTKESVSLGFFEKKGEFARGAASWIKKFPKLQAVQGVSAIALPRVGKPSPAPETDFAAAGRISPAKYAAFFFLGKFPENGLSFGRRAMLNFLSRELSPPGRGKGPWLTGEGSPLVNRGWRIRHKLLLGVALFAAMLALLLGGTLNGLWSYYQTTNAIRGNTAELKAADILRTNIHPLSQALSHSTARNDAEQVRNLLRRTRVHLGLLASAWKENESFRQSPSDKTYGNQMLAVLEHDLETIRLPFEEMIALPNPLDPASFARLVEQTHGALARFDRDSADFRDKLYDDLDHRISGTRSHYQLSLWIIIPTSIFGALLTLELLRFFYGWVIQPIKDLEDGVRRIASGDLDHRITLSSGDEMQDLAQQFNAMMHRLQNVYKDLEKQVNDRSRQLVRSERLASVGFLAAGVSHEINNPLASIAFCAESLETRLRGPDGFSESNRETFQRYLQMIQNEAFRCKKITEKLLAFSRGGPSTFQPTDLRSIINSVIDIVSHLPSKQGKTIHYQDPTESVVIPGNPEELKSVVVNLVVNSLESMDMGGILEIQVGKSLGNAVLRFRDTGCGMDKATLENIFEPFFTQSRTGKGTGLGLTICHCIITNHGGTIEASSDGPGKGSAFTLRLPLERAEAGNGSQPEGSILGFPGHGAQAKPWNAASGRQAA